MNLQIRLLGPPQLIFNGRSLLHTLPAKACALLFYLAVTKQTHSRGKLATLLWGDMLDTRARNNLSIALTKLKQQGLDDYLQTTRKHVAFRQDNHYQIDAHDFEHVVTRLERASSQECQQAAKQYRGEFLTDFPLGQEEGVLQFNDWVRSQRSRLYPLALKLFHYLAAEALTHHQFKNAAFYISQQLNIEQWHEKAYRQKMRLLMLQGNRDQAIAAYQLCRQILEEELAIPPSPETQTLYEEILQGDIITTHVSPTFVSVPFQAPILPTHFVGRETILSNLANLLIQPHAPCVALVGMGGIGKTTVAAHIAHQLRSHFPDGILWANALEQDLPAVLQQWGQMYGYDWSQLLELENLAAAFRSLLADKQVLIVLDNLPSAQSVRSIFPNTPRCAVLITTRDHDVAYALDAQLRPLEVLAATESLQLLHHIIGTRRVSAEQAAAQRICNLLEHLPLAVEIIAQRLRSRPKQTLAHMADTLAAVKTRLDALQLKDKAVRTSFEVSWLSLTKPLSHLFASLAVFSGRTFAQEAVNEIIDHKTHDDLEALVALSLLNPVDESSRYRQHALLADFALEKTPVNTT